MGKKAQKRRIAREKNARNKTVLVFDEEARKEWLTGFSKRKKERQQKAREDLANLLKEEKTRQKEEFRESMKKSEDRFLEKIQDVEKILQEKTKAFECGGKTVEIVEYDLADESGMLGPNQTNGDEEEDETQESRTEEVSDDEETPADNSLPAGTKMPRKMSKAAVRIERRLYKLTHKKKKLKQNRTLNSSEPLKKGSRAKGKGNTREPGKGRHLKKKK